MKIIRWLNNNSLHLDSLVGWFGSTSHYVKVNNTDRQTDRTTVRHFQERLKCYYGGQLLIQDWRRPRGLPHVQRGYCCLSMIPLWTQTRQVQGHKSGLNQSPNSKSITVDGYYHVITIQSSQPLVKPRTPVSVLQEPERRERRSLREVSVLMQESRQMARSSISLTEKVAGNFPEQWKSFIEITFTQE